MSDDVLVTVPRDPLFGLTAEEYVEKIKKMLTGRVHAAYIFGSFTGDNFSKFSDIDLILVCDTSLPFVERTREFMDIPDLVPSTDVLVYTPDEFTSLMDAPAVGFWKSVKESIVRIV